MNRFFTLRLFVDHPLEADGLVKVSEGQAHYLTQVMRIKPLEEIALFNGRDGEWIARTESINRHQVQLRILRLNRPQSAAVELHLFFALLKKDPTDWLIAKATELGVSHFHPMITQYTMAERAKIERWQRIAAEAAEQSQRLNIPQMDEPVPLATIFQKWSLDCPVFLCAEKGKAQSFKSLLETSGHQFSLKGAVMIGPEGGFHQKELDFITSHPFVWPVGLGPRLLRAETAAVASLVSWQLCFGDTSERPAAMLSHPIN